MTDQMRNAMSDQIGPRLTAIEAALALLDKHMELLEAQIARIEGMLRTLYETR
jgi:prefoldin subunit 5